MSPRARLRPDAQFGFATFRSTERQTVSAMLALILLASCAPAKNPTGPGGRITGHVTLATGQVGDVSVTSVQVYSSDPFVAGATPFKVVIASGSASNATYDTGDIAHGDFYLVAWKDNNLNLVLDSGDLRGWYAGGVDGTGKPVAAKVQLVHGQSVSADIAVSVVP